MSPCMQIQRAAAAPLANWRARWAGYWALAQALVNLTRSLKPLLQRRGGLRAAPDRDCLARPSFRRAQAVKSDANISFELMKAFKQRKLKVQRPKSAHTVVSGPSLQGCVAQHPDFMPLTCWC